MSYNLNMSINVMEDDNLSVVDKPIMSTQAIIFIALASASAAFTLGAGIWCLFYGTFGRGLRRRRAREGGRQSIASSASAPEEAPATPRRASSFRLPWLASEARTPYKNTTPNTSPASPCPSSISSLNLQKLYPISPALLSIQASSPNAQVMIQCTADAVLLADPTHAHIPCTSTSTKSLDLKKLWPISPAMLSHQSPHTQMSIRSAMSEQDLNRVNPGASIPAKPVKAHRGFKW